MIARHAIRFLAASAAIVLAAAPAFAGPLTKAPLPSKVSAPLTAPTNLLVFTDPKACGAHGGLGGGLACEAQLPKGGLALAWNYPPRTDFDGFRLYKRPDPHAPPPPSRSPQRPRVDFSQPIATQTARLENGSVATLIVLPPDAGAYVNVCFTVSAYRSNEESPLSQPFCVGDVTVKHVSLSPTHSLTTREELFFNSNDNPLPAPSSDTHSTDIEPFKFSALMSVGHFRDKLSSSGPELDAGVDRGFVLYDLGPLSGKTIQKANLHFTRESDAGASCVTNIDEPVPSWWTQPNSRLPPQGQLTRTGAFGGKTFDVDVTSAVKGWLSGAPNNGLLLIGDTWPGVIYQLKYIPNTCIDRYFSVTLEVDYLPY